MNTLVFSDTHLTHRFDKRKYQFLKKIISSADRVVINGDFWDGYLTTFNKFIYSSWKKLFPLLKAKKTVYVYGNHDFHTFSNKKTSLFSVKQTYEYTMTVNGKVFIFEHGHRLMGLFDSMLHFRILQKTVTRIANVIGYVLKNMAQGRFHVLIHNRYWRKLKQKSLRETKMNNRMGRFFGHVHYGNLDHVNKLYNSGTVQFGHGQYIIIDDKGVITLHEEKY